MGIPFKKIDENHIQKVMESVLDRETGIPFWLEQAERYEGNAKEEIEDEVDLIEIFGLNTEARKEMFEEATRNRSAYDFVSQGIDSDDIRLLGQTGGTTGAPKQLPLPKKAWEPNIAEISDYMDGMGIPQGRDFL